jgi:hypothetical protein
MCSPTRIGSLLAALLAAAAVVPPAASADAGLAVIHDCLNNGRITGHYTQQAYSQALAEIPTDVSEYSNCSNLIRQAQLAAAGGAGGGSGGGSGGGFGFGSGPAALATPITPSERRALTTARAGGAAPVTIGGQLIRPGVVPLSVASALRSLPTTLLAVLIALAGCALAALVSVIRSRVRARRTT